MADEIKERPRWFRIPFQKKNQRGYFHHVRVTRHILSWLLGMLRLNGTEPCTLMTAVSAHYSVLVSYLDTSTSETQPYVHLCFRMLPPIQRWD